MNIGEAARQSGVSAKMIRYYEQIGLLAPPARSEANYRDYDAPALARLRFIRHSRQLGFSIEAIRELLQHWDDPQRDNAAVRALTSQHVAHLRSQLQAIQRMIATLEHLAGACEQHPGANCVILDALLEGEAVEGAGDCCDLHHFGQPGAGS